MAILADHWDEGAYLPTGWHDVLVKKYKCFTAKTGTPGVEFTFADREGLTSRASLYLTEKSLWKLATLAKACGFGKEDCRAYDADNPQSHQKLVGCKLRVYVDLQENSDKYHEVKEWQSLSEEPPPERVRRTQEPVQPKQETTADDDIPF